MATPTDTATSGEGPVTGISDGPPSLRSLALLVAAGLGLESPAGGADRPRRDVTVTGEGTAAAMLRLAARHGVVPLLPSQGPGADAVVAERAAVRQRLVRAHADVRLAAAAAARAGAPLLIVKGPVLAHLLYPSPDRRSFADVDLLTTPGSFGRLLEALEGAGGRVLLSNWDLARRLMRSEVSVAMPAGSVLDVHWDLVNDPRQRREVTLPARQLLAEAVPGPLAGVRTPEHAVHLAYVAWHSVASGGTRLLWACDVELLAGAVAGRAAEVADRARSTGTALALGVAVDFAAAVFPGGAAARLAAELPDGSWRRLNRGLKRRVLDRPGGGRSGAFLPQATRRTTAGSFAAVRAPLPAWAAATAGGPDILMLDRGGAAGRRAYLAEVAAQEG